jgi:hypothetical protein
VLLIIGLVLVPTILGLDALLYGAELVSEANRGSGGAAALRPGLLFVVLAFAAYAFAFWWLSMLLQLPNVVMVEGLRGRAAVRRSMALARRLPGATYLIGFMTLTAMIASLLLNTYLAEGVRAYSATLLASALVWAGLGVVMVAAQVFLPVLVGTLYFKLRAANSEPIDEVLAVQYRREETPTRKWQRRLEVSLYTSDASGGPQSQG